MVWVEKMLHELQRSVAPRCIKVSISTAVWIVMCRQPAIHRGHVNSGGITGDKQARFFWTFRRVPWNPPQRSGAAAVHCRAGIGFFWPPLEVVSVAARGYGRSQRAVVLGATRCRRGRVDR
jgi:hypothetical protein